MPNIIIASFLFIASISMFSFSTLYGAIDRTFNGLDEVTLREGIDYTTLDRPYFASWLTTSYVEDYFKVNLKSYEKELKYTVKMKYDKAFFFEGGYFPQQVNISFQATFGMYKYTNSVSYQIVKGEMYIHD